MSITSFMASICMPGKEALFHSEEYRTANKTWFVHTIWFSFFAKVIKLLVEDRPTTRCRVYKAMAFAPDPVICGQDLLLAFFFPGVFAMPLDLRYLWSCRMFHNPRYIPRFLIRDADLKVKSTFIAYAVGLIGI